MHRDGSHRRLIIPKLALSPILLKEQWFYQDQVVDGDQSSH